MKLLTALCLLLLSCPKQERPGMDLGRSPVYWRDERTGLCFAEFATAYGFYVSTAVPCTIEVEQLIGRKQ